MSGIRVEGNTSGNVAEVDGNNNLHVVLPKTASQAGVAIAYSQNDAGSATGAPTNMSPYTSPDARQLVGIDSPMLDYHFTATAQDTGVWSCTFTTMTMTESGGYVLFNANSTATAATGCSLRSFRTFSLFSAAALRFVSSAQITAVLLGNQVIELGFMAVGTTTNPSDGAYFRLTGAGVFGVVNFNGVETVTGEFNTTPLGGVSGQLNPGQNYVFAINVGKNNIEFWISGILMASISVPSANAQAFMTTGLPVGCQQRNTGTVVGAPQAQFKWGTCAVVQREIAMNFPIGHMMASQGLDAYQGLSGGTMGTTAAYANNAAAGAGAALSNAAANVTGLGGQSSVQPTLVVGTDGIVCSYQVPAGGINQVPRTFMCTGVKIHGAVTTVLAGGPVVYAYSLAFGHTAASMATTETGSFVSGTTKAPRRIPLGFETYAATAPVGTLGSPGGIYMSFQAGPVQVNPGEFIAVCAKNLGVVTTSGVITLHVTFEGYYI